MTTATGDRTSHLAPVLAGALLLFSIGVALPAVLYITNSQEFSVTLRQLMLVSLPMLLVSVGLLAVLVRVLPVLRRPPVVAVLLAVAVLVWVQGNLLVWQYGPLDGREIDWAAHRVHGWIDAAIWISVLGLALWRPEPFSRSAVFVSTVLILLQVGGLAFAYASGPSEKIAGTIKAYSIDASGKFDLSSDRNVFLIVLDEVQSDVFQQVVVADQALAKSFDGFAYFPDAVAGASYTELAIPALLTGRLYDNRQPKDQFLHDAYLNDSVFALLRRSGYRVDIFPWVGWGNETILFDEALADNLKPRESSGERGGGRITEKQAKEIIHLADLSLFRSLPHLLKPVVYNNQNWLLMSIISRAVPDTAKVTLSTDNEFETSVFAAQAKEQLRLRLTGDAFKYYHLKGAHNPLTVTPDMQVGTAPVPFSREAYVRQLQVSLRALADFFSDMQRLGVYDDALIVVVSDHGSGHTEEMYLRTVPFTTVPRRENIPDNRRGFPKDKSRGVPLVMIKRPGATGPMHQSNAAVSALDLPATLATELGLELRGSGVSMFSPEANHERTRFFGAFNFSENKTNYVGPLMIYAVKGHSWEDASWSVHDVLLPP